MSTRDPLGVALALIGLAAGAKPNRHAAKQSGPLAWLFGCCRLTVRYERKGSHFLAFGLAAALTCYKCSPRSPR